MTQSDIELLSDILELLHDPRPEAAQELDSLLDIASDTVKASLLLVTDNTIIN
jgi:hypothetical protein